MNGLFLWRALTVSKQQNVADTLSIGAIATSYILLKRVNFDQS